MKFEYYYYLSNIINIEGKSKRIGLQVEPKAFKANDGQLSCQKQNPVSNWKKKMLKITMMIIQAFKTGLPDIPN